MLSVNRALVTFYAFFEKEMILSASQDEIFGLSPYLLPVSLSAWHGLELLVLYPNFNHAKLLVIMEMKKEHFIDGLEAIAI